MRRLAAIAALALVTLSPEARAEVAIATPGAFLIEAESMVATTPEAAWQGLTRIERWWDPAHTYSGDAGNLRLDARAGGCWCERWGGGQSVEHARVQLVMQHEGVRTLRLSGALGPLQELGAAGVLTFTIAPDPNGAKITMSYRVSGDAGYNFDQMAAPVDQVLGAQFTRLTHFLGQGTPE